MANGNLTVDGNVSLGRIGAANRQGGGVTTLMAEGTFGSGTLIVLASMDEVTWFPTGLTLSADGMVSVEYRAPFSRLNLSGSTTPNINWGVY